MQQSQQQNQPTPKQVFEEAYRMLRVGDVFEAAKRAGKLRAHFPDDAPVLTLHGTVLSKMGVHAQALSDLVRAAQITEEALENEEDENPARPRIVDQLIRLSVLICRSSTAVGEFSAAEEAIDNALARDPDRADAVAAKAELLAARGEHEEAIKLIEEAEQEELDPRPLALARARVLLSAGDASEERLEATRKQLEEAAKEQGLGAMDLGDLLRAIGRINDRFGRYDDAFGSFRRAAKLRRGNYDPRSHTMMTTKIIQDWTVQNMSKIVRPEESGEKFAFVVGAPKSGAGELADMLGQIEGVRVLGPLETLAGECVRHLSARQGVLRPVPLEPQQIRGGQLREAAAGYRAQADGLGASDAQRAIDTHPLNIPLLGAAALMFPGVQIVMCRRDPIECTLACYCQAMPGNHPYAGDLLNAAGFVADCNRMMEHWAKVLSALEPGANIVQVHYADLASDPKRAAVKIAQEIGIDAKGEDIERVPELGTGPASHTEHYQSYLKQIRDLFTPAAKA